MENRVWIKKLSIIFFMSFTMTYYIYKYFEISEKEIVLLIVVLFAAISCKTYKYIFKMDKIYTIFAFIFSFYIVCSLYIGKISWKINSDIFFTKHNLFVVLCGIPFTFSMLLYAGYKWREFCIPDVKEKIRNYKCNYKVWLIISLVLFLCWLPALIFNYPGIIISDYTWQYSQALGTSELTNHHPIIHTMLIRISQSICKLITGSVSADVSVFINSLIQMIIMSLIIGGVLYKIWKKSKLLSPVLKILVICISIWYALFPMFALFSVYMTKDIIFSLLIFVWTYLLGTDFYERNTNKINTIIQILLCALIIWFRGNGFIVVLGTIFMTFIFTIKKWSKNEKILLIAAIIIICSQSPILNLLNVQKTEMVESLGMPINQIANVVKNNEELSDEDEELINAVMPLDIIKETYNIRYSDHLKFSPDFNAKAICDNKGKYLALYCRLLIKYPKDFIEAGLNLTIGYWYPGVDKSCVSYDYDSRYQFYENIGVANYSKSDIYRHFLTSNVRENVFEAWLWSPGVAIMIMFGLMLICLSQKSYMLLLSFMPAVFCWLSLMIATPSYCETRYVFYVFLNIPIWIVLILKKKIEN